MPSLQEMRITLDGIGHVLSDNRLSVPRYQRSYAWEDKNVVDLFTDLHDAIRRNESEYFLGSIVISENASGRPEVVDGQQRLATITILIAALRDLFVGLSDTERASDVEKDYLCTRSLRDQEKTARLQLNYVDHDYFSKRILSRPSDPERSITPSKESHRRLLSASQLARDHVKTITAASGDPTDVLVEWIDYVQTKAKVILVRVPDDANAFTIFETLNDRGLDLATSDLLKNFLFGKSQDRIDEAQSRWNAMVEVLEAAQAEENLVTYIRQFWSSKNGLTRERDLYKRIKERITSKQQAVNFASELANGARTYSAIINPDHEIWEKYGPDSAQQMRTLNLLGVVQVRPVLMAILAHFSTREVRLAMRVLVSASVRLLVTGLLGSGPLENLYAHTAKIISEGTVTSARQLTQTLQKVVPSDSQFRAAFSTATVSKTSIARYYLQVLEGVASGKGEPTLVPNSNPSVVNLEHILPQKPDAGWSSFSEEEQRAYCNRIGNLALLAAKVNSTAGNESFAVKKATYKNAPFELTSEVAEKYSWTPGYIEERQTKLAALAVKAWPMRGT